MPFTATWELKLKKVSRLGRYFLETDSQKGIDCKHDLSSGA